MKRFLLLLALWLPQIIRAQTQLTIQQPAPPATGSVSASYSGPTTGGNIFYWVVVRYPAGAVNPVGPAIASGVTRANISASAPVTITWAPVQGASGYDVIYADTSNYPANPTCTACGVSLNTSATSVTDTGAAGSAYPPAGLAAAGSATATFNLNNVSEAAPFINIQLIGSSINNLYRLAPFAGTFTNGNCVKVVSGGLLQDAGIACTIGGGGLGTVTNVGLALPSFITVTGSPVTTTGTLTGTLATQTANLVFAGPTTGVPAAPTFRALVAADIPSGASVGSVNGILVSALPPATGSNRSYTVYDATSQSDCTQGGGSITTSCVDIASGLYQGMPVPANGSGVEYVPNQVIAGCGVEYVSGLSFNVGECFYVINGVNYRSPLTTVTLTAADGSNPRIDALIVDTSFTATKITGTAAAAPAVPTVDSATQLFLTSVLVPTSSPTPGDFTATTLYDENTEWTCTASANFNCASASNPYRGTTDIEATTAALNNNVTLVKPAAGTENLSLYRALVFYIRSKGTWPTGNGSSATRSLSIWWQNGSTQVGDQVVIRDGQFGFRSSGTASYQQIYMPVTLFNTGSALVTTLKFNISGNSGSTTIGFYLDAVSLQTEPTVTTPTSTQRVFGVTVDGGGSAITTGVKGDTQIPVTCRINYWTIRGDQSGSIVFDIWKTAFSTSANPTVANTITASAKPTLSSAINSTSTSISTWTSQGQVTAGDMIRFNVDSATTVTRVSLIVGCLQ